MNRSTTAALSVFAEAKAVYALVNTPLINIYEVMIKMFKVPRRKSAIQDHMRAREKIYMRHNNHQSRMFRAMKIDKNRSTTTKK